MFDKLQQDLFLKIGIFGECVKMRNFTNYTVQNMNLDEDRFFVVC